MCAAGQRLTWPLYVFFFLYCDSSEAKLSEKTAMQVVPFEPSLQVAVHVEKVKSVTKE